MCLEYKHEPSRSRDMGSYPQKNTCSEIESVTFRIWENCYEREISLAVNARVANAEGVKSLP